MKKTTIYLMCGLMLLSVASCKKEDKDPEPAKTKTDHLTVSNWRMTGLVTDPAIDFGGTKITDIYTQIYDPCDIDDFMKYEKNGTGIDDEGPTKCDPADPQKDAFVWAFSNNETQIVVDGDPATLDQLDETTMKQSYIFEDTDGDFGTPGIKYKWTATFKH